MGTQYNSSMLEWQGWWQPGPIFQRTLRLEEQLVRGVTHVPCIRARIKIGIEYWGGIRVSWWPRPTEKGILRGQMWIIQKGYTSVTLFWRYFRFLLVSWKMGLWHHWWNIETNKETIFQTVWSHLLRPNRVATCKHNRSKKEGGSSAGLPLTQVIGQEACPQSWQIFLICSPANIPASLCHFG